MWQFLKVLDDSLCERLPQEFWSLLRKNIPPLKKHWEVLSIVLLKKTGDLNQMHVFQVFFLEYMDTKWYSMLTKSRQFRVEDSYHGFVTLLMYRSFNVIKKANFRKWRKSSMVVENAQLSSLKLIHGVCIRIIWFVFFTQKGSFRSTFLYMKYCPTNWVCN